MGPGKPRWVEKSTEDLAESEGYRRGRSCSLSAWQPPETAKGAAALTWLAAPLSIVWPQMKEQHHSQSKDGQLRRSWPQMASDSKITKPWNPKSTRYPHSPSLLEFLYPDGKYVDAYCLIQFGCMECITIKNNS